MIVESNPMSSDSSAKEIFSYISENSKNEDVQLLGGSLQDVENALVDAEQFNRKNGIRHFQISSKESLTDEQFKEMIERVKAEFHISDDDIVFSAIHTFKRSDPNADPRHAHLGVRLVNPENGKVKSFDNLYQRQEKISRMAEVDYGFQLVKGAHNRAVWHHVPEEYKDKIAPLCEGDRPQNSMSEGTIKKLTRLGKDTYEIKQDIKNLFAESQTYSEFKEKIEDKGWTITNGTKKPDMLVMNDENGIFLGSVNRLTGIKKKDLDALIASPDSPIDSFIARHIPSDTIAMDNSPGIASRGPALETSEKPQEVDKDASSTTDQSKAQKPSDVDITSIIASVDSEKSVATDDMSIEEKQAVSFFNKQESEKDELTKMQLSAQKKLAESMQTLVIHDYNFYEIWGNWSKYVNNEINRQTDIINQEHPRLKHLDDKQVRSFLYKNFKSELSDFKERRNHLITLRKEIREHDKKSNSITGLYHGYQKNKKSAQEEEQMEQLKLLAQFIIDSMLHKMGFLKNKPDKNHYLTEAQREAVLAKYKRNEYAKLLVQHDDQSKAINSLSTMKVYHRDGVLNDFKNRPEVEIAREMLRKLEKVKNIELSKLNPDEYEQFESHIKDLDVDSVNKLMTEHSMRTLREEREKDKTNAIGNIHENDIEQENPSEIEKNIYRKKMKKSGQSFNR
ncbi:hypothetical protein [Acetobacter fallax]|uniref:Uncharacterized protein n=1 Tax=Acetobacter fallax TaxID=1737473 RepID=A0ABX0KBQ9_9PROT|nr:hypothetical protein [Acetobacter fallax]NHO32586.1 hypothetical protein [Acetobacter fallax]NHO36069.1 hypothetical protein [Acetobacter fallax]